MNVHPKDPARYKTKKSVREAVKAGTPVPVYTESAFHDGSPITGRAVIVGPSAYQRKWYADAMIEDGNVVRIIS